MPRLRRLLSERNIRYFFDVSLLIKGFLAVLEVAGGVAAWFISRQFLLTVITTLTADELAEDPRDFVANHLLHAAQQYSVSTQHFAALYLFSHGAVKLFVIAGLLRQRLWYYPTALVVFGLFIAYQLYRYTFTHSAWLLALTVLDLVVMGLTWHEWRYLRARRAAPEA